MKFFESTMKRHSVRLWRKLCDLWPFMTKRFHVEKMSIVTGLMIKSERQLKAAHAAELEERTKRVNEMIERWSQLNWNRDDDGRRYRLSIEFDPRMIGYGNMVPEELSLIGERIAWQVLREIESSKFVHSANETRRNERFARMPVGYWNEQLPETRP